MSVNDDVWDDVLIERWPNTSSPVFVAHVVAHVVVYASSNGFIGRSSREEM